MNIGIDLRFWRESTGGIGRYSRNLLKELLAIDSCNNYTAIITEKDEAEFRLKFPNLKKIVVKFDHYSLAEQKELPKILKKENFNLIHFTNFNHPATYREPFVVTIHDLIMDIYPSGAQKKSLLRRLAYSYVMNDCKRAQKIIVPSESTRQDLIKKRGFDASKIVVIPEGVESGFRLHTDYEKDAIIQKYQLPKDYLLFVSRWETYKGLPILLDSFKQLKRRFPDLGLVICGSANKQNPEVASLVKEAQSLDNQIITPGFVDDTDLQALYAAARIYVHPSWYEGFGLMILEAFASGVPVVTSNVSSLPEVVGEAGLLIDPKNVAEITQALTKLLEDPDFANELANRGLARVAEYSWQKMAEETLSVYKNITRD